MYSFVISLITDCTFKVVWLCALQLLLNSFTILSLDVRSKSIGRTTLIWHAWVTRNTRHVPILSRKTGWSETKNDVPFLTYLVVNPRESNLKLWSLFSFSSFDLAHKCTAKIKESVLLWACDEHWFQTLIKLLTTLKLTWCKAMNLLCPWYIYLSSPALLD